MGVAIPVSMTIETPADEAENYVRSLATALTTPRRGECLACFVHRQLAEFGCDNTLRFAVRYRDVTAPRASALEQRLGDLGGFCDCEIFLNGYTPAAEFWTPEREIEDDRGMEVIEAEPPETLPDCRPVRRGSTRPCTVWARHRRW